MRGDILKGLCKLTYPNLLKNPLVTIRSLLIISLAIFLLIESQAQNSDRPNVLMISIDDLNDWTGFLDGKW